MKEARAGKKSECQALLSLAGEERGEGEMEWWNTRN